MLQSYAIAFRGDDRDPQEIFPFGFRRRHDSWNRYVQLWEAYLTELFQAYIDGQMGGGNGYDSDSDAEPTDQDYFRILGFIPSPGGETRLPNFRYNDAAPQVTIEMMDSTGHWQNVVLNLPRTQAQLYQGWLQAANQPMALRPRGDIDPASAVCVTDRVETAVLFPLPAVFPQNARDSTWLYVIRADNVYVSWQQQVVHQQHVVQILGRSRELAARDIPLGHVFAAVEITRRWRRSIRRHHQDRVDWRAGAICTVAPQFIMNPAMSNQPHYQNRVQTALGVYLGRTFHSETFEELPDHLVGQ